MPTLKPVPSLRPVPFTGKVSGWSHWTTPPEFLERVRKVGPIVLDPCANAASVVGAREAWCWPTPTPPWPKLPDGALWQDGLALIWAAKGLIYVNPPYNDMRAWARKLVEQGERGSEMLALLPAKTDTHWFHALLRSAGLGCLVEGRLKFGNPPPGSDGQAPSVASAVFYWGPRCDAFLNAFADLGETFRLQTERE